MASIINSLLLYGHIIAGFSALILFWVPVFTRKGSKRHRQVGKWYVQLMWVVVISALVLSAINLIEGDTIMAAFLGFLALISGKPLWQGIAILQNKRSLSQSYQFGLWTLTLIIVAAAVGLIAYGIALNGQGIAILMFIFAGIGLTAIRDVFPSRLASANSNWIREHIAGMCISGIAAHTAFLAFGANNFVSGLVQGYWQIVPWVLPTVVGAIGITVASRKYRQVAPAVA